MSNGPWEVTHGNMGIQLVKLNEVVDIIFKVKNIPKILKNHARRSFTERWDMHMKFDLNESKDNSRSPFG